MSDADADEARRGLASRARTRSYGSTARHCAVQPTGTLVHRLDESDTLQGLSVKYGVAMEQIKLANRLYTGDSIFLKKTLLIPVYSKPSGSPPCGADGQPRLMGDGQLENSTPECDAGHSTPKEVSARDYLSKLDSQIRRHKMAAKKINKAMSASMDAGSDARPVSSTSYQSSQNEAEVAICCPLPRQCPATNHTSVQVEAALPVPHEEACQL
uniref:lysM and putative peptidoglycan-binding domain-containing protein 2-like n=1 Tax=Myxine glutinosa TaxID=7769 RepID=UPI00358EC283